MSCNEIKISFKAPKAYVDSNKKTARCGLYGILNIPENVAKSLLLPSSIKIFTRGESVCMESDNFDGNIGRKIALAKAENKAYVKASSKIWKAWLRVNDCVDPRKTHRTTNSTINDFLTKAEGCVLHNLRYINAISK